MVSIGSIYRSVDDKRFTVDNVITNAEGTWIFYSQGEQSFSCLIDAFLQRFNEVINERSQQNNILRRNTSGVR